MSFEDYPFVTFYSHKSSDCPLCASEPGQALGGRHFDSALNHLARIHGYVLVHIGTEVDVQGYKGPAGDAHTVAVFADKAHVAYLPKK
jgi:hypothetical protein